MRMLQALVLASGLIAISIPASAQWLNYPDPRIPRTADGKPNLVATAPKLPDGTPDFSGIWRAPNNKDWPNGRCLPNSVTDSDAHQTPRKIIQQPGLIAILYESYHYYRQIFTDGRPLPDDREPAWFGYSVGKWDGDTLVVDTVGLMESTWLDAA